MLPKTTTNSSVQSVIDNSCEFDILELVSEESDVDYSLAENTETESCYPLSLKEIENIERKIALKETVEKEELEGLTFTAKLLHSLLHLFLFVLVFITCQS